MKAIISTLILSASLSLVSTQAFSHTLYNSGKYLTHNKDKRITTPEVSSKSEAYENGLVKLQALVNKSGNELGKELNVWNAIQPSIHLDGTYVSVDEYMNKNGKIVYKGIVNTSYHYQVRD